MKRELLFDAAARAAHYVDTIPERPVAPSHLSVRALSTLTSELADGPTDPRDVIALLDSVGSPATVATTGGRYFGFVNGGTEPVALAAAVLNAAWDQNVALPVMSPSGAYIDEIAARWVLDLLGLPSDATATFCSGASIANLTCILAARDALLARLDWSVAERGLAGAPPLRVVASAEIHSSVAKALRAAGIGRAAVTPAPTDESGRVDPSRFPAVDDRTLVLLQAGNVNTGSCDPFDAVVPHAQARGAWVHIDGAFGLWAAASPARRHLVTGAALADSWATDAHKWLNAPYDSGVAICARSEDLRRAMSFDAAYFTSDADRPLAQLTLQMSQRARAVETWAIVATLGRSGIAALVDRMCTHAERMAALLQHAGAEVLAPVALNQVLVHFDDDDTTAAVIDAVQADGRCWAGGTTWHGRRAMRISVTSSATTDDDIAASAGAIVDCWRTLTSS
jgi:glutamate/tyrosine decarboxylase-like PLP-dependent enzyme